jgi:hypothetical protein
VDRQAAKLGSPGETILGIDSTHNEMCKFSRDDEDRFSPIKSHLHELAEKARKRIQQSIQEPLAPVRRAETTQQRQPHVGRQVNDLSGFGLEGGVVDGRQDTTREG